MYLLSQRTTTSVHSPLRPFPCHHINKDIKKTPTATPDTKSRFAEVTRLSKEARARKPKQVPDEQRPNPYKIDVPNVEPLKENDDE
jgi:hypothetical protein